MHTKIEVVESELMKTHALVERLSYELNVSNMRLAEERDSKRNVEQFLRKSSIQYVAYFEARHSERDGTDTGDLLTIDDFLRLGEEEKA